MRSLDRFVLYMTFVTLLLILGSIGYGGYWAHAKVADAIKQAEALKAKALPAIEMANKIAERLERWENRQRLFRGEQGDSVLPDEQVCVCCGEPLVLACPCGCRHIKE